MKRTLLSSALILSLLFSLTLCGCSKSSTEPTQAAPASSQPATEAPAPTGETAKPEKIETVKLRMLTDESNTSVAGVLIDNLPLKSRRSQKASS